MQTKADTDPRQQDFRELVRESHVIFVGTVTELGEPAKHWSGRVPSFQSVSYKVSEYLKGSDQTTVSIAHVLVKESPTAAPGDTPRLSPKLFAKGARLVVCAERTDDKRLVSMDERFGAQADSDALRAEISGLLQP